MSSGQRTNTRSVTRYEGLIFKTARRIVDVVEEDLEDIQQILRLKAWQALNSYNPARSRLSQDAYVFACLMNQKKDILKRKRLDVAFNIEVLAGDESLPRRERFEMHYLALESDTAYVEIEAEIPLIPSTLTRLERTIVVYLYTERTPTETARALGLKRIEMEECMGSIRTKFADWAPSVEPSLGMVEAA